MERCYCFVPTTSHIENLPRTYDYAYICDECKGFKEVIAWQWMQSVSKEEVIKKHPRLLEILSPKGLINANIRVFL